MSRITRKYEAVDLMKLYSQGSSNGWNEFLTAALNAGDINRLARMRYALQAGMDDLTKIKMNNEKMIIFYVRLMKSVEETAKKVVRRRNPMPHDMPLNAEIPTFGIGNQPAWVQKAKDAKRKRDLELERFFMSSSY